MAQITIEGGDIVQAARKSVLRSAWQTHAANLDELTTGWDALDVAGKMRVLRTRAIISARVDEYLVRALLRGLD